MTTVLADDLTTKDQGFETLKDSLIAVKKEVRHLHQHFDATKAHIQETMARITGDKADSLLLHPLSQDCIHALKLFIPDALHSTQKIKYGVDEIGKDLEDLEQDIFEVFWLLKLTEKRLKEYTQVKNNLIHESGTIEPS